MYTETRPSAAGSARRVGSAARRVGSAGRLRRVGSAGRRGRPTGSGLAEAGVGDEPVAVHLLGGGIGERPDVGDREPGDHHHQHEQNGRDAAARDRVEPSHGPRTVPAVAAAFYSSPVDRCPPPADDPRAAAGPRALRRVGHKGADAITPGNTLESFRAAVEAGVDMIEFDVLRPRADFAAGGDWRRAPAGPVPAPGEAGAGPSAAAPLLVAHDWGDAARREPMTLVEALDAFTQPPLDSVEMDLDLKVAGREDEVAAALEQRGLTPRAMVSTMEVASVEYLHREAPGLRRGWTYPRVTRPWDRKPWARPVMLAALVAMRRRLPVRAGRMISRLGLSAIWVYNPLVTRRLVEACEAAGAETIAWTVDDPARMRALNDLGVHGICTNDPRLLGDL